MTCFARSVHGLGLFMTVVKPSKISRFESKDRSSDQRAANYHWGSERKP
jgi:hypothetical protein